MAPTPKKPARKSTRKSTQTKRGKSTLKKKPRGKPFETGNPGGHGGARPGAGRKPSPTHEHLEKLLSDDSIGDRLPEKIVVKLGLTDQVTMTPLQLSERNLVIQLCENVDGIPTELALEAGKQIMDRLYGKPVAKVEVVNNERDLDAKMGKAEVQLLARMTKAAAAAVAVSDD